MWAVAGIVGGAIIGAVASSSSADKAADAQIEASRDANSTQLAMYESSRQDQLPWMQAGQKALTSLEGLVDTGPGDFASSDYYQQGLAEEQRAIDTYMASRGQYASGKAGKELTANALSNVQKNRGNWLNEWIATKLNPTQSLAGVGQTTATNVGVQGIQTGRDLAGGIRAGGDARASGYINQGNAITSSLQGGTNALAQYYGSQPTSPAPVSPAPAATGGTWA